MWFLYVPWTSHSIAWGFQEGTPRERVFRETLLERSRQELPGFTAPGLRSHVVMFLHILLVISKSSWPAHTQGEGDQTPPLDRRRIKEFKAAFNLPEVALEICLRYEVIHAISYLMNYST